MAAFTLTDEYALEMELARRRAQNSLLGFVKHVTPSFQINWHHRVICEHIDKMVTGDMRRLMVTLAPRHGKSEIISRHLPGYILGRDPNQSIIACSYGAPLAQRMNRDAQRIIDSELYREVFPKTTLFSKDLRNTTQGTFLRNADMFEVVNYRGVYKGSGVGGAITGMGGNWLLLDDLIKNAEDANSATIMESQFQWYVSTLRTRLAKNGRILLVMTRWTDDDIPGRLLDQARSNPNADQWNVINLPAINENGPTDIDPRQPGEALWPQFFPIKELTSIRAGGPRAFQALYQGDPVPPGGNIVQRSWWRFYKQADLPAKFERVIISMDATFKDKEKSDYCVLQLMGKIGGRAYLLTQIRQKMGFLEQLKAVTTMRDGSMHPVREIVIEDAANGAALVDTLKSSLPNVIAVRAVGSKQARAEAITPIIEAGNFYLPDPMECPWVSDYTIEWERFPHAKNDDVVDCTSLALSRLFPHKGKIPYVSPVSLTRASPWLGH